jgi:hypothetical protein
MPLDLAEVTNAPEEVRVGPLGPYRVARLTFYSLGRLQRWLNRRAEGTRPTEAVKKVVAGLSDETRATLEARAVEASAGWVPPQVMSLRGRRMLFDDDEGVAEFVRVLLQQENPSIAEDDLAAFTRAVPTEGFNRLIDIAFNQRVEAGEDGPGPKAERPPEQIEAEARVALQLEQLAEALAAQTSEWKWIASPSSAGSSPSSAGA